MPAALQQWIRSPLASLLATSGFLALAIGALSGIKPSYGILGAFGLIFVGVVLTNLQVGFAALMLLAYLEVLTEGAGLSLSKVAGILIVVAWIATASTRSRRVRNFFVEHAGYTYLLLAFLGWSAISTAWSPSPGTALQSVFRYALDAFLIPIAYTAVRDRRDLVHVLAAIVGGASIAAASAIISPPPPQIAERATGTVGDPNELAAALIIGLGLATAFAANRHVNPGLRALAGVAALLSLVGILVSLSRGGLIGLGVALLFATVAGGRWRRRALGLCVVLAFAAVAYFAFFASLPAKERVLDVSGEGGSGRLSLWTVGLRMIEAHPLNGVGTGQFPLASVHYLLRPGLIESGKLILTTPKVAHNTYLNIVAEMGIVGGVLFISILLFSVGCALLAVKRVREAGDEKTEMLLRGFVVGLAGYMVTLLFLSEMYSKLLWIVIALGPAMLAVATDLRNESRLDLISSAPARAP